MGLENFHHEELMKRMDKIANFLEELVRTLKEFQREEVRAVERTITYHPGAHNGDEVD